MHKSIKLLLAATFSIFLLSACDEIIVRDHHYHDDYYHYNYYPDLQVYYDTRRGLYFYHYDGRWISRRHLPRHYRLGRHRYHRLRMRHARPWRYNRNWRQYRYRDDGVRRHHRGERRHRW